MAPSSPAFSTRRLNRATLARQLLLDRAPLGVVDTVRSVVVIQAQEPASLYLALWNRAAGFDPAALDAALAEQAVIRATLMRITLHAVAAEDYPPFHTALLSSLRASRLNDRRFAETGWTVDDADATVADLLGFLAETRTNAEVEAWIEARAGRPVPRAWWALRTFAPVVRAPNGGPWSQGTRAAYTAARAAAAAGDDAASTRHLVRRYLEGFGPATAQDIAQFTILRQPAVKAALEGLGDAVEVLPGPGRSPLYDVPGGLRPDEDVPVPPRLLPMWDSSLLAYADRSRIIPEAHRAAVIRRNGDVLPTLLVDGAVAGVWRPVADGIEATAFAALPRRAWTGLAAEAAALVAFLADRDPGVYGRFAHWWPSLPAAEVRVLPG